MFLGIHCSNPSIVSAISWDLKIKMKKLLGRDCDKATYNLEQNNVLFAKPRVPESKAKGQRNPGLRMLIRLA